MGVWRLPRLNRPRVPSRDPLARAAYCRPADQWGADWRRGRLDGLDLTPVSDSLRERAIPDMSALAIMFAIELLDLNLGRLRDAIGHHA